MSDETQTQTTQQNESAESVERKNAPYSMEEAMKVTDDILKSLDLAWEGDPISAFGSIICFTEMDCMGSCNSLLGICYQCLHDDDCWPGRCILENHVCGAACRSDKNDFARPNPERFDRFIACVDEALEDKASTLLEKYAGPVSCGPAPADGPCEGLTEQICNGALELLDGDGSIEREQWFGLCALTRLDVVHRIEGSHFMP